MSVLWIIWLATGATIATLAFLTARVWIWAKGDPFTPPPRDVRLWLRVIAPDYTDEINELWPE